MSPLKLVSFGEPDRWTGGILYKNQVISLSHCAARIGWSGVSTVRSALEAGLPSDLADRVSEVMDELRRDGHVCCLSDVRLGPPIPDPEKIICIGLNYHDHAEEVGAEPPKAPIFFAKYANSLVGPYDHIVPPRDTHKVDYEAELAVVIGRSGRYIDPKDALNHVAGAMVLNDVSARDLQLANQLWTGGKAIDTFAPCGPWLTLAKDAGDLMDLSVTTSVNRDVLQNGNTRNMIFGVVEVIAFLSRIMTLRPGDIIATGTPAGVAASHDPARFLNPGDLVEVEVSGLGALRNPVAEPA
ncbi:MAG: fumarylacetoacetate hydrolase family protein [Pseudomonadota bacterium]